MKRYIGNDFAALEAEKWTMAALVQLQSELVVARLFNRDYEVDFAVEGDVVNVHKLGVFVGDRLEIDGTLAVEAATSTNLQVKLNQHLTQAFKISDRDQRKTFKELISLYIIPSAVAMAEQIDLIASGERYQFYKNQVAVETGVTYEATVNINKQLTIQKCPRVGRWLIGGPQFEADILLEDKFIQANMTGDGSPIINGIVGRGSNFQFATTHTFNENGSDTFAQTVMVINDGNITKGSTVLTVNAVTDATGPADGEFLKLNGFVYRIAASTITSNAGTVTIEAPGLYADIVNDDVIAVTTSGAVDAMDPAVDHSDWIDIDGAAFTTTRFPEPGDGIAFGTAPEVYGVYKVDEANDRIKLNRPLDAAVADGAIVAIFPKGNYNFAMVPGASTIIVRAMAIPIALPAGNGGVATDSGWALRGILSYNHVAAGSFATTFSYDTLLGVKTIDTDQGALLISV